MDFDFYTFTVGLEFSLVIIGLFSIISLSTFDFRKNRWLMVAFGSIILPWIFLLIGPDRFDLISNPVFLPNPAFFILFPPFIYFYTYELVNPNESINLKWLSYILIYFLVFFILFFFIKIGDPNEFVTNESKLSFFLLSSSVLLSTLFFGNRILKLVSFNQRKLKDEFANTNLYNSLYWLKWLVWVIIITPFIGIIFSLISLNLRSGSPGLFVLMTQLMTLCCLIYFALRQPIIYQTEQDAKQLEVLSDELLPTTYSNITIDNIEKAKYIAQIESHMNERKPYLNPKIRMPELAKQLGIPRHIFSYLINDHFQMNFFQFINQYRIDFSKTLLKEDIHKKYTLEAISEMSGFNSKSTFNTRFKEITGISPKEYQQRNS